MTIDRDDPRITAYIMGELSPAEREAFEAELAGCAESQALVEELRQTAALLGEELEQEAAAMPSAREKPRAPRRFWSRRRKVVAALASAAACLTLVVLGSSVVVMRDALAPSQKALSGEVVPQWMARQSPMEVRSAPAGATVSVDGEEQSPRGPVDAPEVPGGDRYARVAESPFHLVTEQPLSTFSVDVDTAAYANVRRFLNHGALPPADAVRVEELVNYFDYSYPEPTGPHPFSVNVDQSSCPWNPRHSLVRIGLRGKRVHRKQRPPGNLVFLLDVSGSMSSPDKLPLLRRGMDLLVRQLGENDRVAVVVYAGASGLVLPSTACTEQNKPRIRSALERLQAGGSTNGGAGIQLAYDVAVQHFIQGGVNRVILATDGDFNVGTTSHDALIELIRAKAKSGVFLSVLGFGRGNLNDATLEQLADRGNGNYAYIDTENEARKVLVEQMSGTLVTIAKDVKIQVELNPARVAAYRLLGYENRRLAARDFDDDEKDAGEIGAGHTVTALYELVPAGIGRDALEGLKLKYQRPTAPRGSGELMTVKLRYKQPDGERSRLLERAVEAAPRDIEVGSADLKLAAAVAWFGMVLRDSPHVTQSGDPLARVLHLARQGATRDPHGYRAELVQLIQRARQLKSRR